MNKIYTILGELGESYYTLVSTDPKAKKTTGLQCKSQGNWTSTSFHTEQKNSGEKQPCLTRLNLFSRMGHERIYCWNMQITKIQMVPYIER